MLVPRGGAVSYERGTLVQQTQHRQLKNSSREALRRPAPTRGLLKNRFENADLYQEGYRFDSSVERLRQFFAAFGLRDFETSRILTSCEGCTTRLDGQPWYKRSLEVSKSRRGQQLPQTLHPIKGESNHPRVRNIKRLDLGGLVEEWPRCEGAENAADVCRGQRVARTSPGSRRRSMESLSSRSTQRCVENV